MKSILFVLILIAIILVPSIAFTQQTEGRYWYVDKIEIKPKKVPSFEKQLNELSLACVGINYPRTYSVCKSIDNIYYVFHEISGISEIDKIKATLEQMVEDMGLSKARKRCVLSTQTFVIRDLLDLNYIPITPRLLWEHVGYTTWELHTVKQNQVADYKEDLHEFQSIKDCIHYDDPSFVFEIVEGADDPTFILMSYGRDQEDREDEDSRLWQVIGNEGKEHFERLFLHMTDQKFLNLWKLSEASYIAATVEESL